MPIKTRKANPAPEAVEPDETPIGTPSPVLTVNGQPIPAHLAHAIPFAHTDQGIAEANKNRVEPSGITFGSDPWDKAMDQRANASEVWESADPLSDTVARVKEPGFAYKLLSKGQIEKKGLRRYEIVKENTGDPVSVGNMILGKMPITLKEKRNKFYRDKGNLELKEARMALQGEVEKAQHDNQGIGVLTEGANVSDGENSCTIGMDRHRGQLAA